MPTPMTGNTRAGRSAAARSSGMFANASTRRPSSQSRVILRYRGSKMCSGTSAWGSRTAPGKGKMGRFVRARRTRSASSMAGEPTPFQAARAAARVVWVARTALWMRMA